MDVLDECSRKVPSPYIAEIVLRACDAFMEFFEGIIITLDGKE